MKHNFTKIHVNHLELLFFDLTSFVGSPTNLQFTMLFLFLSFLVTCSVLATEHLDEIFDYNNPSRYGTDYSSLPKMSPPELCPSGNQHLSYLHPLTMLVSSDDNPYDHKRVHYKLCIFNATECTHSSFIDRRLRSIEPGQSIGITLDNVDDAGLGRDTNQMERPIKVTVAAFTSSGISWMRNGVNDVPGYNHSKHSTDSETIITEFYVEDGIYGMAYLSPYYNGEYSGSLAEVDLKTEEYNSVRIHGLYTDFADFYSEKGTSPYIGETSLNSKFQVDVTKLDESDEDLKGFQNSFSALKDNLSYVFLSPYFNGKEYFGKIVRLTSGEFDTTNTHLDQWTSEFRDNRIVDVLDLTQLPGVSFADDLRGFVCGFWHGDFAYFVPSFNGKEYSSKLVRVHIRDFTLDNVEVMDLKDATHILDSSSLAGFYGGFAPSFQVGGVTGLNANFGYLVPYKNMRGPVGGINTKHTSDGFKYNSVVDEQESYGGDHLETNYHGKLVRFNADSFDVNDVEVIDLQLIDENLKGFATGFVGGKHGYLVPYSHGMGQYFGIVVRFDLLDFRKETVEVLNLEAINGELRGFVGGFSYDHYAFFVPYQNGRSDINNRGRSQFSKVVRVDLNDFSADSVIWVDVAKAYRKNVPDIPNANLRGFNQGFVAGSFMYLLPHFNGVFFGKICRYVIVIERATRRVGALVERANLYYK